MKKIAASLSKFGLPLFLTVIIATSLVLFTVASGFGMNGGNAFGYGYGGGGGGGVPPTTTTAPVPEPGAVNVTDIVTDDGTFTLPVVASLENPAGETIVEVDIPQGVVGTVNNAPIDEITIIEVNAPPVPPENVNFVGIPYDFGPDGAVFNPPITITFTYTLPEGVDPANLTIGFYDESKGEWVELTDVVVNADGTISGKTSHFTTFAVLIKVPAPVTPAVPTQTTEPAPTTTKPAPAQTTEPVVTAAPGPTQATVTLTAPPTVQGEEVPFNWTLPGILLAVVVVLAIGLPLYLRARRD